MTRTPKRRPREVLPSEKGLLEMTGRQSDLSPADLLVAFRDLVSADMDWIDSRKVRFRKRASLVKVSSLVLAASSTIILGIQEIPARASIALPLVAAVTLLGSLETFFNWRSRWILMEEAQYRLNRLRDEMDYYIVSTPSSSVERERIDRFFEEQQQVWNDVSQRWIEFRRLESSLPVESVPNSDRSH